LEKKSFDKLSDYADDFINYLAKFPHFTGEMMRKSLKSMCIEVFRYVLIWIIDELHKEFDGKENLELPKIDAQINKTLKHLKVKIKDGNDEDEKSIKVDYEFIDSNLETIQDSLKDVFKEYNLTEKQIVELVDIFKLILKKCGSWINRYTGIVIAGYGEQEIFPALCRFKVGAKLGNSLIYYGYDLKEINSDRGALICPFAQTDMVFQFLMGLPSDFYDSIMDKVDDLQEKLMPLIKDFDKGKVGGISTVFTKYIKEYSEAVYKHPVQEIVAAMNKSDLASMAEAMVNLTALKRHVSTDEETVGGFIDVALITKEDGFIWIKKKTNYDPHLNRNLMQKYFRGEINEDL